MDTNKSKTDNRKSVSTKLAVIRNILKVSWNILKKRWFVIILTAVAAGLIAGIFAAARYVPTYTSSVSFMLKVDPSYANKSQINDVNDSLVHTYEVAFKYNREFCRDLNELAGTADALGYTADDVASMMRCEQILPNTPALKVTFSCPSARAAFNLATALQILANTELEERFSETLDAVDVFNEPEENTSPINSSPFLKTFTAGLLIAAAAMFVIFLFIALTDRVIHGESSMESFSDYPILGIVPTLSGGHGSRSGDSAVKRDRG